MLPEPLVRELRYIEVVTARRIRTLRVGTYTSRVRGAGFDFDAHRVYVPGDDVRRMDWNATARLGTPFVRETHADRELKLVLLLDVSRSMAFGSGLRDKKALMLLVAACLVFSALADQIAVGVVAFAETVLRYDPPRRARGRAWRLLEALWALDPPRGPSALLPAVEFVLRHLRTPSLVVIVSDFVTDECLDGTTALNTLAARHDVVAVIVEDPAEARLPAGRGVLTVRDLESHRELSVGVTAGLGAAYEALVAARRAALGRGLARAGIEHVVVRTDRNPVEPLLKLFLRRRRP